jgi:hypothetical protein
MLRDLHTQNFRQGNDGVLYFYDDFRDKWLSDTKVFLFGANHKKIRPPRYLKIDGGVVSNNCGYRIPRDATITGVTVEFKSSASGTFQILVFRSPSEVMVYQFSVIGERGDVFVTDVDINEDDVLRLKMTSGEVDYPVISAEIAWRI